MPNLAPGREGKEKGGVCRTLLPLKTKVVRPIGDSVAPLRRLQANQQATNGPLMHRCSVSDRAE
jgi:hypothetical protein